MTNERNDRTSQAFLWFGHVLGNYVTGDWDETDLARELATATWHGLSEDFGEAARRLDTAGTLHYFQQALAREVEVQVALAKSEGATWEQVGRVFGTTRQAAQMRFGKAHARDADLRACCDHPAHEPGRCEFFTAPRTDFPGSIERCDCDGNSPTIRD